jgi:hypothetical protein
MRAREGVEVRERRRTGTLPSLRSLSLSFDLRERSSNVEILRYPPFPLLQPLVHAMNNTILRASNSTTPSAFCAPKFTSSSFPRR